MDRYQTAKAFDDLAQKAIDLGDRVGTKTGDAVDRVLGSIRSVIPVGCTRDHGHDEFCAR